MQRLYIAISLISFSSIASVILIYIFFFFDSEISRTVSDWGSFGNYIGGLLSPILSFFALIGILLTLHQTNKTNEKQWGYLKNIEKKREWLVIIEHAENQIQKLNTKKVERNDGVVFELGSALLQIGKHVQESNEQDNVGCTSKVIANNWNSISIQSFYPLSGLIGDLSLYLEKYSACVMEEDASEIVGHYYSSYIGYVFALNNIGLMSKANFSRWENLITVVVK